MAYVPPEIFDGFMTRNQQQNQQQQQQHDYGYGMQSQLNYFPGEMQGSAGYQQQRSYGSGLGGAGQVPYNNQQQQQQQQQRVQQQPSHQQNRQQQQAPRCYGDSDYYGTGSGSGNNPNKSADPYNSYTVAEEPISVLKPEQIRWFYKYEQQEKDWTPFSGFDSLRIEIRYRTYLMERLKDAVNDRNPHHHLMKSAGNERKSHIIVGKTYLTNIWPNGTTSNEHPLYGYQREEPCLKTVIKNHERIVIVRGGIYEVDLETWICSATYWTGDNCTVTRGTWFYDGSWQPLTVEQAERLEHEHLEKFLVNPSKVQQQQHYGKNLQHHQLNQLNNQMSSATIHDPFHNSLFNNPNNPTINNTQIPNTDNSDRPVLHRAEFPEFHVDWFSSKEIHLFSTASSQKFMRSFGQKFGFQNMGYRLCRGYFKPASIDDRPEEINHIVFVIHGIGHKMDTGKIARNTSAFRECVREFQGNQQQNQQQQQQQPQHHQPNQNQSKRVEFFPVEWRSSAKLDGDIVEDITPQYLLGLRQILNATAMDIMYYNSPLYRTEIQNALKNELNRIYFNFVTRNPQFEAQGGKVSILAHSLGVVILYDIVTGYSTAHQSQCPDFLKNSRVIISDMAGGIHSVNYPHHPERPSSAQASYLLRDQPGLLFQMEGASKKSICNSPSKLEPLLNKHYINIAPVPIPIAPPPTVRSNTVANKLSGGGGFGEEQSNFIRDQQSLFNKGSSSDNNSLFNPPSIFNNSSNNTNTNTAADQFSSLNPFKSIPVPNLINNPMANSQNLSAQQYQNQTNMMHHNQVPTTTSSQESWGFFSAMKSVFKTPEFTTTTHNDYPYNTNNTTGYNSTAKTSSLNNPMGMMNGVAGISYQQTQQQLLQQQQQTTQQYQQPQQQQNSLFSSMNNNSNYPIQDNTFGQPSDTYPSNRPPIILTDHNPNNPIPNDLDYRMDYILREGNLTNSYLAALGAHTSYWSSREIGYFVINKLYDSFEI